MHFRDILGDKFFTVMILPHTHSEMKQLKIPHRLLYLISGTSLCCFIVILYFTISYAFMANRTEAFSDLQKENGLQKQKILKITDDLNDLNAQMESLMVFSRRLQILMGLDAGAETQKIGGFDSNEIDRFSVLYKKNQQVLLDQIETDIEQLQQDIPQHRAIQGYLNEIFEKNSSLLASIPSISPVTGGWISSPFGMRSDPFTGRRKMHYGLDIAQNKNALIYATADGIVTYSKRSGSLGKLIEIDHGFGFCTRYAHLATLQVKFGQKVKRGDVIGRVGSTGRSRGLHLHYEVRMEGIAIDPLAFILDSFES